MASMSLAEVKLIGRAFGATVNDVVLAIVGGALKGLLEERGERLDSPLVAMVPVSTRERPSGSPAIADAPTLGNKVSAMLVSLATTIEDPVERLIAVSESSRGAKTRTDVLGGRILDDWAQLIIPAVSTRAARLLSNLRVFDRIAPVFNVTVSNVPGPQFRLVVRWLPNRCALPDRTRRRGCRSKHHRAQLHGRVARRDARMQTSRSRHGVGGRLDAVQPRPAPEQGSSDRGCGRLRHVSWAQSTWFSELGCVRWTR